jgi:hypothetical protein
MGIDPNPVTDYVSDTHGGSSGGAMTPPPKYKSSLHSFIWANSKCILGANKLNCQIFVVKTPD